MDMGQAFWDFPPFEMFKSHIQMEKLWCQTQINTTNVLPINIWSLIILDNLLVTSTTNKIKVLTLCY